MTAKEIKDEYPIYPDVKVRLHSSGMFYEGITAIRKKFRNKWYLLTVNEKAEDESTAKSWIENAAKVHQEFRKFIDPDSPLGNAVPGLQVLDDNQND